MPTQSPTVVLTSTWRVLGPHAQRLSASHVSSAGACSVRWPREDDTENEREAKNDDRPEGEREGEAEGDGRPRENEKGRTRLWPHRSLEGRDEHHEHSADERAATARAQGDRCHRAAAQRVADRAIGEVATDGLGGSEEGLSGTRGKR